MMKNKKYKKQFKFFSIFQYENEQEYLRNMHNAGWKFIKVSGLGVYHFEACEPQDVVYQLDYNQDGLERKSEYVQLFNDCGWEYIQDYMGYSYFRKPAEEMNGEEEIFCDDESRLAMMHRVYKGRMLPLVILFSCVMLPQLILNIFVYHNDVVALFFAIVMAIYLYVFATFAINYYKYKNNIKK